MGSYLSGWTKVTKVWYNYPCRAMHLYAFVDLLLRLVYSIFTLLDLISRIPAGGRSTRQRLECDSVHRAAKMFCVYRQQGEQHTASLPLLSLSGTWSWDHTGVFLPPACRAVLHCDDCSLHRWVYSRSASIRPRLKCFIPLKANVE